MTELIAIIFDQVSENQVFKGAGGQGDIRNLALWRLADRSTGTAVQVKMQIPVPAEGLSDVEENGSKSATFFAKNEKVVIFPVKAKGSA